MELLLVKVMSEEACFDYPCQMVLIKLSVMFAIVVNQMSCIHVSVILILVVLL